jgi:small subunit ribosomal protein S20
MRQAARRKVFNDRRRRAAKVAIKETKEKKTAETLSTAFAAIDKAVKRGVMHKNAAARKKSQLAKLVSPSKK